MILRKENAPTIALLNLRTVRKKMTIAVINRTTIRTMSIVRKSRSWMVISNAYSSVISMYVRGEFYCWSAHADRWFVEIHKAWPPCMRIIVKETSVKNFKAGKLFVVTCAGGTLGREGDHSILIPDINISKVRKIELLFLPLI